MEKITLQIDGMSCASCAGGLEGTLQNEPGEVETVDITLFRGDFGSVGSSIKLPGRLSGKSSKTIFGLAAPDYRGKGNGFKLFECCI